MAEFLKSWEQGFLNHIRASAVKYENLTPRAQEICDKLVALGMVRVEKGEVVENEKPEPTG